MANRYGTEIDRHLNYIESYVPQQVPYLNEHGNRQLAYDAGPYTEYQRTLGGLGSNLPLKRVFTTSLVDRLHPGKERPIPNWSFVTNHDQEKTLVDGIPVGEAQAAGAQPGSLPYEAIQFKLYDQDRARTNKKWAPLNVDAAYALLLSEKWTVPTVYYGDLWDADDPYMSVPTPYHQTIERMLHVRAASVSGGQKIQLFPSTTKHSGAGRNLLADVRFGRGRKTGVAVVVGDDHHANEVIHIRMGHRHAGQRFHDALGFHKEVLTADRRGTLTVHVHGTANPQVSGYLAAWVPGAGR